MGIVRVGIVGFGRIGAEHAGWLSTAEGIRAAATADVTPARRKSAAGHGIRAHAEIDELLGDSDIDAVLISTPTAMHFDLALRALEAGKHVMIEKPMTLDLPTARKLVREAEARGKVLSVFHNRRWDIDYLTVRSAVDAGIFGRLINVESRLGQWSSCVGPAARDYRPAWRNEASFGGGGLYDWGSHFIDQLWRVLLPAKPVRVYAQLRGNVWTHDCDDFARVLVDFDNGCCGLVEINTTTTRPLPRWHLDGTNGSAESPFSLAFDLNTWADFKFTPADVAKSDPVIARAAPGLSEREIWEAFGRAVRGDGEPAVTARSVLPTMALLDAARESSRLGRAVDLAGETELFAAD